MNFTSMLAAELTVTANPLFVRRVLVYQLDASNNHRHWPCFALGASINKGDDAGT
jgi:hypothetical protein